MVELNDKILNYQVSLIITMVEFNTQILIRWDIISRLSFILDAFGGEYGIDLLCFIIFIFSFPSKTMKNFLKLKKKFNNLLLKISDK